MNIEAKFLFISRFFVILFIVINLTYLIPLNIFDITFYSNLSTAIVDTSTLLILGLAFPKFVFLKNIQKLKKLNDDYSSSKIKVIKRNSFYNTKISQFISIFFVIVALIQPINIVFTLNKNDTYSYGIIESFNNKLKMETQLLEKELSIINKEESNTKLSAEIEAKKEILKDISERNINNFIEINNKKIFNQVKFIIRNLIMALVWAFVFYKLSNI